MADTEDYADGWSKRFKQALLLKQLRDGGDGWTQANVADAVSKLMKRKEPLTSASVSRWMLAQSVPDCVTQIELSRWLGVDPGWLMAGSESQAPEPELPARTMSLDITRAIEQRRGGGRKAVASAHKSRGAENRITRTVRK